MKPNSRSGGQSRVAGAKPQRDETVLAAQYRPIPLKTTQDRDAIHDDIDAGNAMAARSFDALFSKNAGHLAD
ncbi:MAG: hypothetical protein LBU43_05330 [Candidatus Accumulibacter sp.]|nr:hypothetical protein [Accumulibacter sp.]